MWGLQRGGDCGCFGSQESADAPSPSATPPPKKKLNVDSDEKPVARVKCNLPIVDSDQKTVAKVKGNPPHVDSGQKPVAKVKGNPPKQPKDNKLNGGDNALVPIEIFNGFAVGYDAPVGAGLGV